jgi:uncharacterized protein YigA (DUF484 family)
MARIDIDMKEYQGMRDKIKNLESALNSVSTEAAINKELLEKARALVVDLDGEGFLNRLFSWSSVTKPLKDLFGVKNS